MESGGGGDSNRPNASNAIQAKTSASRTRVTWTTRKALR